MLASASVASHGMAETISGSTVDAATARVDFIYDGLFHSPEEYTRLLCRLADEGDISPDRYSNGGVVEELENKLARLLGKECAVFMPTGTLANHIALRRLAGLNTRAIVQAESHIYNDSGDCAQVLSNLNLLALNTDNVNFSLDDVIEVQNRTRGGRVKTGIGVISIESPVRRKMDRSFGCREMHRISEYASDNNIAMHLDGARLFAECVHTGWSPAEYGGLFDTVYTSLYKCFSAASGAVLAGTKEFCQDLYHVRRMFGGGQPAVWPFAAVANHFVDGFLDEYTSALAIARQLAAQLNNHPSFTFVIDDDATHIWKLKVNNVDLIVFRNNLEARGIDIYPPGFLPGTLMLKINPSLNRSTADDLAGRFIEALG